MERNQATANAEAGIKQHLSLFSSINIIIGIVVGVSIFRVSPLIFSNSQSALHGLLLWTAGGVISMIGALCYAELATTYPGMGGDYVYLSRAYHPAAGFLFGWSRLAAIQTGSIGALAYVFADYAAALTGIEATVWFAAMSVVVLTLINLYGVTAGRNTQNLLTIAKVVGITAIFGAGILWMAPDPFAVVNPVRGPGTGLAMILILYAYGGWNETAFVAAEMVEPEKTIPRTLILGTAMVTLIYLLINLAYITGLGFEGLRSSTVPAADILRPALGELGTMGMSIIVIFSVLGALNGTILTGARVNVAMGKDHKVLAYLGAWNKRWDAPTRSLTIQALTAILMIFGVGTENGRSLIDRIATAVGLNALPWQNFGGGFDTLVSATAPAFWLFFLMTGVSLFVLRYREPERPRPFKVPLYPITPTLFCLSCFYMLYSSINYAGALSLFGLLPILAGIPLYLAGRKMPGETESMQ